MKHYLFKTTATMKEYNNRRYWIDGGIITEKHIHANNVLEALEKYRQLAENQHYIIISNNAIKRREPMYIDTKAGNTLQTGFVITGSTEFENNGMWTNQFIDLWVEILEINYPDFGA